MRSSLSVAGLLSACLIAIPAPAAPLAAANLPMLTDSQSVDASAASAVRGLPSAAVAGDGGAVAAGVIGGLDSSEPSLRTKPSASKAVATCAAATAASIRQHDLSRP